MTTSCDKVYILIPLLQQNSGSVKSSDLPKVTQLSGVTQCCHVSHFPGPSICPVLDKGAHGSVSGTVVWQLICRHLTSGVLCTMASAVILSFKMKMV